MLLQLSLALLCYCKVASLQSTSPVVDLGYAKYQGTPSPTANATNFYAIRFAAAPEGKLRWQAPQDPPKLTGIQRSESPGNQCMQQNLPWDLAPMESLRTLNHEKLRLNARRDVHIGKSEDCLFVNVHIPGSEIPVSPLPVIVWIHGGGYQVGNGSSHHGEDLIVEANGGVVVAVIQYRLALFGFLAGKQVKEHGVLNAGLLDQQFAFKWVQKYIHHFGGDPTKVTIWGESAGAGSVLQHLIAQNGHTDPPLFRAAITSSTYLPPQYQYDSSIPESTFADAVRLANCTEATNRLDCLRSVDVSVLAAVNQALVETSFYFLARFSPVVDGHFITQRPTIALAEHRINRVPLLVVTNEHEGDMFVDPASTLTPTEYILKMFPLLPPALASKAASLYADFGDSITQMDLIHGESMLICASYYLLDAFDESFKAEFAPPPALHFDDYPYYFTTGTSQIYPNAEFAKAFSTSFSSFAISLDPNEKVDSSTITPTWPSYREGRVEMLFNRTEDGAPVVKTVKTDEGRLERCAFWRSVGAYTGQ